MFDYSKIDKTVCTKTELDITCPVCGQNNFQTAKHPDGNWCNTVFWCRTGLEKLNRCSGVVCYCKKCEKMYPAYQFGKHGDVYECKECGTVQWEYTDYKKDEEKKSAFLRRMSQEINYLKNSF